MVEKPPLATAACQETRAVDSAFVAVIDPVVVGSVCSGKRGSPQAPSSREDPRTVISVRFMRWLR